MLSVSWLPSRGYLERAQAPILQLYQSEQGPAAQGPVPLYRDFILRYHESLKAARASAEIEATRTLESDPSEAKPEPEVSSPQPSKKVRVFHSGGATLRGPYSFPRPQHADRLFDEIYLHFPVAVDQNPAVSLEGELNQSAVFEPPTAVVPSSSSSYLQVP